MIKLFMYRAWSGMCDLGCNKGFSQKTDTILENLLCSGKFFYSQKRRSSLITYEVKTKVINSLRYKITHRGPITSLVGGLFKSIVGSLNSG